MTLIVNHEVYEDTDKELPYEKFYADLQGDVPITTSQTATGTVKKACIEALKTADQVLFFSLSSSISGQYDNLRALIASDPDLKGKVVIYDTKSVLGIIAEMAFASAEISKKGGTIGEALDIADYIVKHSSLLFQIYDISFLEKSGRAKPAVVAFCRAFKLIPILEFRDGTIRKYRQSRTVTKAIRSSIQHIVDTCGTEKLRVYIGEVPEKTMKIIKDIVKEFHFGEVLYSPVPRVLLAHIGSETMGVLGVKPYKNKDIQK